MIAFVPGEQTVCKRNCGVYFEPNYQAEIAEQVFKQQTALVISSIIMIVDGNEREWLFVVSCNRKDKRFVCGWCCASNFLVAPGFC